MDHSELDFKNGKYGRNLTNREIEVLKLITLGKTNNEIATDLSISYYTAKSHACSILEKLGVKDRVQAAVFAVRNGMV